MIDYFVPLSLFGVFIYFLGLFRVLFVGFYFNFDVSIAELPLFLRLMHVPNADYVFYTFALFLARLFLMPVDV